MDINSIMQFVGTIIAAMIVPIIMVVRVQSANNEKIKSLNEENKKTYDKDLQFEKELNDFKEYVNAFFMQIPDKYVVKEDYKNTIHELKEDNKEIQKDIKKILALLNGSKRADD